DADTSLFARIAPSMALDAFLFLPVNPSYTSTLLKTENRKINLLNHPVCGKPNEANTATGRRMKQINLLNHSFHRKAAKKNPRGAYISM
ncbi:TPA: hypothetical protein ACHDW3_003931, partial [Morganella morganii]